MKRLLTLSLMMIFLLLALGLEAKKSKKNQEPVVTEEVEVPVEKPIKIQAQEKAREGEELVAQEQWDAATEAFENALNLFVQASKEADLPDSSAKDIALSIEGMYKNLTITCEKAGDFPKTLEYLDKRMLTDTTNVALPWKKYTILKDEMQDEMGGIAVLEKFAANNANFEVYQKLGSFYAAKSDLASAIKWYQKAYTLKKDADVIKNLGKYFKDGKRYADSNKYYEEYLTMTPPAEELPALYKILGSNYKALNNNAKAIEYYEKFLTVSADTKVNLALLDLYFKANNYNKTIVHANKVLTDDPENSTVIFVRANCKYKLNDKVGAKADFEKVKNDPKYGADAQKFLAVLK